MSALDEEEVRRSKTVDWVGPKPERRRMWGDYCVFCGILRGVDVLNYRGPCQHEWERVIFVPEALLPKDEREGS